MPLSETIVGMAVVGVRARGTELVGELEPNKDSYRLGYALIVGRLVGIDEL